MRFLKDLEFVLVELEEAISSPLGHDLPSASKHLATRCGIGFHRPFFHGEEIIFPGCQGDCFRRPPGPQVARSLAVHRTGFPAAGNQTLCVTTWMHKMEGDSGVHPEYYAISHQNPKKKRLLRYHTQARNFNHFRTSRMMASSTIAPV